jgi:hypothetical protein
MRCTLLRGKKGVFLYFILLKYVRGAAFSKSNDLYFEDVKVSRRCIAVLRAGYVCRLETHQM